MTETLYGHGAAHAVVGEKDGKPYTTDVPLQGGAPLAKTATGGEDNAFSREQVGNKVKFFTTGEDYFTDVAREIRAARESIFICAWELDFDVQMQGGSNIRLWDCLAKALANNKKVRIYALPWASPKTPVNTNDLEAMCAILLLNAGLDGPMRAFCLPALSQADMDSNTISFSHHQKSVIIDNKIAYVGGLDLAYGRRDDNRFSLRTEKLIKGRERYNPCIPPVGKVKEDWDYLTTMELISTVLMEGDLLSWITRKFKSTKADAQKVADKIGDSVKSFPLFRSMELFNTLVSDALKKQKGKVVEALQKAGVAFLKDTQENMPDFLRTYLENVVQFGDMLADSVDSLKLALLNYLQGTSLDDIPPEIRDAVLEDIMSCLVRLYTAATNLADMQETRYSYLAGRIGRNEKSGYLPLMPPGGLYLSDAQPRMPWQDVHCRIEGPSVYDLSMNFVRRWNGLQARMTNDYAGRARPGGVVDLLLNIPGMAPVMKHIVEGVKAIIEGLDELVKRVLAPKVAGTGKPERTKKFGKDYDKDFAPKGETLLKRVEASLNTIMGAKGLEPTDARGRLDKARTEIANALDTYQKEVETFLDAQLTDQEKARFAQARKEAEKLLDKAKATCANKEEYHEKAGKYFGHGVQVGEVAAEGLVKGGLPGMQVAIAVEIVKIYGTEKIGEFEEGLTTYLSKAYTAITAAPEPHYIPAEMLPRRAAPEAEGSYSVQVLRSAPARMLKHEQEALALSEAYKDAPADFLEEEKKRVAYYARHADKKAPALDKLPLPPAQDNCHDMYVGLILRATHFLYIEGQFFQSEHGEFGRVDPNTLSGPMGYLLDPRRLHNFKKWDKVLDGLLSRKLENKEMLRLSELYRLRWGDVLAMRFEDPDFFRDFKRAIATDCTIRATNIVKSGQDRLLNNVGEALATRIERAINARNDFHVYIVLPVHPEGRLDSYALMSQIHLTQQSLFFGEQSLVNRVRRAILVRREMDKDKTLDWPNAKRRIEQYNQAELESEAEHDWKNYLTILNLRNWDMLGGNPVTEQIYVHSKLLIADDRCALLGSANINDRSLLGGRDSELAVFLKDKTVIQKPIDGKNLVPVSKDIHELRVALWKKHFGLTGADLGKILPAKELESVLLTPAAPKAWRAIQGVAEENRKAYEDAFHFIPRNESALQDMNPPRSQAEIDKDPVKGKRGASIWPCWHYENPYNHAKVSDKLEPNGTTFERPLWQPFESPYWEDHEKRMKKAEEDGEKAERRPWPVVQEPRPIYGFITAMPELWTAGENNLSPINFTIIANVPGTPPTTVASAESTDNDEQTAV